MRVAYTRVTAAFCVFALCIACQNPGKTESAAEKSPAQAESMKAAPAWPDHLDAVAAAPANHKVMLENDDVRVLDVTVQPGEREKVHGHKWRSVLYVISEGEIKDYDAAGNVIYDTKTDPNPMKPPYTVWMEPQAPHAVENLSKEPLRLIRVELKK